MRIRQKRPLSVILLSAECEAVLMPFGRRVLAAAEGDPNPDYRASLRLQTFRSRDRVHVQVGAAPIIGMQVEAKRGTLGRAVGAL